MRVTSIGLKGWKKETGEWSWTPDVMLEFEGESPLLEDFQVKQIEAQLEQLKDLYKRAANGHHAAPIAPEVSKETAPTSAAPATDKKATNQGAAPQCTTCRTICETRESKQGHHYQYCPTCKANRRRDGTPFPESK